MFTRAAEYTKKLYFEYFHEKRAFSHSLRACVLAFKASRRSPRTLFH